MEKKLVVIVDNKEEVTTEIADAEMCSSACDVAMETCSSECHDALRDGMPFRANGQPKTGYTCKNVCGNGRIKESEGREIVNGYSW